MSRRDAPRRLPDRDDILAFIRGSDGPVGKREIARAFGIKGADRVALKRILADLKADGLLDRRSGRRFADPADGRLPPVTVIRVTGRDADGEIVAAPDGHDGGDPPRILLARPRRNEPVPGVGDRVLARLRELDGDPAYRYEARPIKILGAAKRLLGVFRSDGRGGRVVPVDKKASRDFRIEPDAADGARDGELVEAEALPGRGPGLQKARIVARLGSVDEPRSISLIAIHENGLPTTFSRDALAEAEAAKPTRSMKGREDLRDLPLVTIDPADARDHDDAVFAAPDDDPGNPGGHVLWVAIADVAHYVRPGTALDHDARERGNSAYFPDRVVPMLPERLSGDLCSLHAGKSRPCLALRVTLGADGAKRAHRFVRAMMRSAASLTYDQAQAAAAGRPDRATAPLADEVIAPLFAAYRSVRRARERRAPLDLDLPERRVILGEDGDVRRIEWRERFDAHRMIEEFMILANVCAAETLEAVRRPLLYRVHEEPNEERIESLREMLSTVGVSLPKGQRMTPARLNRALDAAAGTPHAEAVNMAVLRAQTQAYYSPENYGHFGLNLDRYAHFTSPIRRYADLVVHRALIAALNLGADPKRDGQGEAEIEALAQTAEHISMTERRAMVAERDTVDRYLAAYMRDRIGGEFEGVVTGVARFGLFVRLDETGADALAPISSLGNEYFRHDPDAATITGARSGVSYGIGDRLRVRLVEAAPLTGGLTVEIVGVESAIRRPAPRRGGFRRKGRGRGPRR